MIIFNPNTVFKTNPNLSNNTASKANPKSNINTHVPKPSVYNRYQSVKTKSRYKKKLFSLMEKRDKELKTQLQCETYNLLSIKLRRKLKMMRNARLPKRFRLGAIHFYSDNEFVLQAHNYTDIFGQLSAKLTDPYALDLMEDLSILLYDLYRSTTYSDILMSGVIFLKLRLKGSLLIESSKLKFEQYLRKLNEDIQSLPEQCQKVNDKLDDVVGQAMDGLEIKLGQSANFMESVYAKVTGGNVELQNELFCDETDPSLTSMRSMLDNWPKLKDSLLFRKMRRVMAFVISLTMWEDKKDTSKLLIKVENEEYASKAYFSAEFAYSMADFLLFILERGFQCCQTGSFQPIFHSGESYENWYNYSLDLLVKSKYLDNPDAFKIDRSEYTANVIKAIEQGKAIYKYASNLDKSVKKIVSQTLFRLNVVLAEGINRESLESVRRAPFSVLVSGHSSVAKTSFINVLHMYFASLLKKPKGMQYKYTKTLNQDYWEGYSAEKYTIVFDDIALENERRVKEAPSWLNDIIKVINNTPIALDMAFEGKGKVPCMAELVLATTNSPHLNANAYASCPLAILRRWALHIHIKPKPEYTLGSSVMIDPSKLDSPEPGHFPDYWIIQVFKVESGGVNTDHPDHIYQLPATTTLYKEFDNMNEFLKFYGQTINDHRFVQDKVILGDKAMTSVDVCSRCLGYKCSCPQMELQALHYNELYDEFCEYVRPFMDTYWAPIKGAMIGTYCTLLGIQAYIHLILIDMFWDYSIPYSTACDIMGPFATIIFFIMYYCFPGALNFLAIHFMRLLTFCFDGLRNDFVNRFNVGRHIEAEFGRILHNFGIRVFDTFKAPLFVLLLIKVLTSVMALAWMSGSKDLAKDPIQLDEPKIELQGGKESSILGKGSPPPGTHNEKESSWIKPDYVVTDFDFNRKILSWKGLPPHQVNAYITNNVVSLIWFRTGYQRSASVAICLAGNFYLTTNHTVPEDFSPGLDVVRKEGERIHCMLSNQDVIRFPEKDLCLIRINGVPVKRSIKELFSPDTFVYEGPAMMKLRDKKGVTTNLNLGRVCLAPNYYNPHLNLNQDMYFGTTPTSLGMCGAPICCFTDVGPIILGLHEVGNSECCGSIRITQKDIQHMMQSFTPIEPSCPDLHGEILAPIHHKSPVNFVQDAQIDVYGTLGNWRPTPTSHVARTLSCPFLMRDGFPLNYGKPIMAGWQPWYRAFKEITDSSNSFNENYIEECKESMLERWSRIPMNERKLQIYDIKTCVNGYPGCKFVDKINRNTSAGFPFRETKKRHFIYLPSDEIYQDPIQFTDEIHEMVQKRYDLYQNNQQSHPIFVATLKDEPLKMAKIKAFKTRVFYGGPVDFTIIVRMALLSFLRLSMNNPFVFESSPGINAHGKDWSDLYKYLTKFGEHRMIFGDFSDYDITMRASLILHAFHMIAEFHRLSGCSEEHLKLIRGIAYDIAYPLVDFNGTLITMFGKNPSGHPLTVVINGLVNCIYMRYCYRSLNPLQEVKTFNINVQLTTYGDDNGQGVSTKIDWYNHTSISSVLAKHNVTYTMADKESKSVSFIHISQADFLKRKWRYDKHLEEYMAPLEMNSIIKSLMIGVKSKAISNEVHIQQLFHSAMLEFAHHGYDVYNEWYVRLNGYITELNLQEYFLDKPLLTHEEVLDVYFRNELSLQSEEFLEIPACKCLYSDCCIIENDDSTRICNLCLRCRYDDLEIDCIHCGYDDTCPKCLRSILVPLRCSTAILLWCPECKEMVLCDA